MLATTNGAAWAVFAVGAAMIAAGGLGVVLLRNPVHCALMLVTTLFGVALEFIDQSADFLAAVQVIVYAGAIVILFLFVIMYLGVDRSLFASRVRIRAQVPLAVLLGAGVLAEVLLLARVHHWSSGISSRAGALSGPGDDVQKLGESIFTRYLLPFEMTAALLVVAVVAAVVLSRGSRRAAGDMTRAEQFGEPENSEKEQESVR
jgi:NADH-quinone oxidoreductase subunit J